MDRKTTLTENVALFCRFLRKEGFITGSGQQMDAVKALTHISFSDQEEFKNCLKITLSKNQYQFSEFDRLFGKFWKELKMAKDSQVREKEESSQQKANRPPPIEVIKDWLHGNHKEIKETHTYDPGKIKGQKDFSIFSWEDLKEWEEVIRIVKRKISDIPGRRLTRSKQSGKLNMRASIRESLRSGGELIDIQFFRKKPKKANLIILADVSRSMELYSREILRMMFSFQNSNINIETFVFSTSLFRVTQKLKTGNFRKALQSIAEYVDEWSGGTRLGESFDELLKNHNQLFKQSKTYVFIVSDGLENGNLELFESSMKTLSKRTKRIFWFNPLAKSPNFEAQTRAMQVAGNHIDYLIPAAGVKDFKGYLEKIRF